MAATQTKGSHRWRFFRAGGVDQVRIETGADIAHLANLDQKLWVALSCPVKGLEFDQRTLELLDVDKDGRVRVPEILNAIEWLKSVLKNLDGLVKGEDGVPLSAINDKSPEGQKLLASAQLVLENLGKAGATVITVGNTLETEQIFKTAKLNGDGIVPAPSVDDAAAKKTLEDILATLGGETDRSGLPGVSEAKLEAFFKACADYVEWLKKSEADKAAILPLGDATAAACDAMDAVAAKIDDFFARCRLAAYDARAQASLNGEEARFLEIAAKDLSITRAEVQGLPLSKVEAGRALDLTTGINPAWHESIGAFRASAVASILGKDKTSITEADWAAIKAKLAPNRAWRAAKVGAEVEKLGAARVKEILAGKTKEILTKAIAADKAVQPQVEAISALEKLARLWRDLHELLNNFVSFANFYSRRQLAVFQSGTLYLDSRSCDLCVRVEDAGKHGSMSPMARTYLAYCDCTNPKGEKMTVAAAFTAGDSDYITVGRNGIFYDRKGRDWDATVTKIVDQPISIGQAFFAPYKRFLRWIEEQVAKRAAAADAASNEMLTKTASETAEAVKANEEQKLPKSKFDVGVVAALGVAVGGIAAAVSSAMNALFGLGGYMPLGILGIILLISGPSMVIAWLKLRQRNLGPLLDANGWACNGRVKVNIPLGASLTDTATLPPGSERSLTDPFAAKKAKWPKVVLWLFILAVVLFGVYEAKPFDKETWYQDALHFVGLDTKTERAAKEAAKAPVVPATPPVEKK